LTFFAQIFQALDGADSQAISWSDPREESERKRLKTKLAAETQALQLLQKSNDPVGNLEEVMLTKHWS
jgi:hypothetical protein